MIGHRLVVLLACLQFSLSKGDKRPFYIIAHMANSVSAMDKFVRKGANAIETDISFGDDGTALWAYHGVPCDALRLCHESTPLNEFLQAAAQRNLTLLFLDLKSSKLSENAKDYAGEDLAYRLHYFFDMEGGNDTNVVLSVPSMESKRLLSSYIAEMKLISPWKLQTKTSFDVSEESNYFKSGVMFLDLNVDSAWAGDGITNWFEGVRNFDNIKLAIRMRDEGYHHIKKVYRWTVDGGVNIRKSIELGCDGVMTNEPSKASKVMQEFGNLRLARQSDNINERYKPPSSR